MNKKYLSCLAYSLFLAISFLLPGFTEATPLLPETLSLHPTISVSFTSSGSGAVETAVLEEGGAKAKSLFLSTDQAGLLAVTPDSTFHRGQSELIRRFPVAVLLVYGPQLACRNFLTKISYSFSITPSALPGLPVLLRSLRL